MRGINSFANRWIDALTYNGLGKVAFGPKLQTAVLADLLNLGGIMPTVPKEMKLVDSPLIDLTSRLT